MWHIALEVALHRKITIYPPEMLVALGGLLVTAGIGLAYQVPMVFPSDKAASLVGIHYIGPLVILALLLAAWAGTTNASLAPRILSAITSYAIVLFCHFNLKLWLPLVNRASFDPLFWSTDQRFHGIVDFCEKIRLLLAPVLPFELNLYMILFVAMFYASFLYHALRTPQVFGSFVTAIVILQMLGGISYLLAPAVGPFVYEPGVNPYITLAQSHMLAVHQGIVTGGQEWLRANGSQNFTAGLAAMPSLHCAGAALFLLFAWQHGRVLFPSYALITAFILVTSVASRWHYLIDVPFGLAMAVFSYKAAGWLERCHLAARRNSWMPPRDRRTSALAAGGCPG